MSLKYIDQAYDEDMFPKRIADVLAIISGIMMGLLMVYDTPFSTAYFLSLIIATILAGKIDNRAFAIGTFLALSIFFVLSSQQSVVFLWGVIVILLAVTYLDEVMDEVAHKYKMAMWMRWLLHYRPFTDIAIIVLVCMGTLSWVSLMPYLTFNTAYRVFSHYTDSSITN